MEYLSTSALANELDLKSSDLFDVLKSNGLIDRKNDKWKLTELGIEKGGQTRNNPKFGEYIVWPENLKIENGQQNAKAKYLNATTIGKEFTISSQRMNLILSELGWIEKNNVGWEITKAGKNLGGKQFEHETSGGTYVLWPENILSNKGLLEVFKEINQYSKEKETSQNSLETQSANNISSNYREKFESKHRTIDGHYVKSISEMVIDNWLYHYGMIHAYERKLPILEEVYCDFYIPSGNGRPQAVYIEYWGIENDPKYQDRKTKKIQIYKNNEFPLIELTTTDIQNIDDILPKKLRQFKIQVGS